MRFFDKVIGLTFVLRLLLVLITLITLQTTRVYCQNKGFVFRHFTTSEGLSQGTVYAIDQDKHGFMWFGTQVGLNKFDGYTFKVFKHDAEDPSSIGSSEIIAICWTKNEKLWVGTRGGGLSRFNYDTENFHTYRYKTTDSTDYPVNTVNSFYEHTDGELLVGTNNGLATYDPQSDKLIGTSIKALGDVSIRAIVKSTLSDAVWLGTKRGLYLYHIKEKKIIKSFTHDAKDRTSISSDYITAILQEKTGMLWVGTYNNGLNRLDDIEDSSFVRYTHNYRERDGLRSNVIRTLNQGKDGAIWIGTRRALERLSVEEQKKEHPKFKHFISEVKFEDGINHSSIYSFFEDASGDYWIGNYSRGVDLLYNGLNKFDTYKYVYSNPSGLGGRVVSSFVTNGDNKILIGLKNGNVDLWDRKSGVFQHYRFRSNDSKGGYVKALELGRDSILWVGTFDGLFRYDCIKNKYDLFLKGKEVTTLELGEANELWVGTSEGLIVMDIENFETKNYSYSKIDSTTISHNSIKKILKLSNGDIWVGTRIGLNYYDRYNDGFVRYIGNGKGANSLSHDNITSICEGKQGRIWVGTCNGVNRFNPENNSFEYFNESSGLTSGVILNVISDLNEDIWLTTKGKLVKCNPDATPKSDDFVLKMYDSRDGLQKGSFRIGASMITPNGDLFLGGTEGFSVFNPDELQENLVEPKIVLTDLKLSKKSINAGVEDSPLTQHINNAKSITLKHDHSFVEISYAALNYVSSGKNEYAYKLEGLEEDWNYAKNRRYASYNNIPPGKYTFKVKGSNNDGLWSTKSTSLEVIILPAWWETWLFRLLFLLVVLLSIWVAINFRFRSLNRKKRLLEEKITERTQELEEAFNKLKDTQSQLVQSEKMASIGLLTSGVAHEINNPLNFIQGGKNYIDKYVNNKMIEHRAQLEPMLEVIQVGLDRTVAIVSSLNKFNRKKIRHDECCEIHQIIDDCLIILQSCLRHRVEVEKRYTKGNVVIYGNQGELHQLILNIISNAEQSITGSGAIKITTEIDDLKIQIKISDNGEGISDDNISKVMDPFFTTKEPGKGVGLGMSISFSIVERHGGTIEIESEINLGTTVIITLPITNRT